MNKYQEIEGDLIKLAQKGMFDVVAHGCNCFCTMGAGIAPQMVEAFGCDKYHYEHIIEKGNINKLGMIDFEMRILNQGTGNKRIHVVNAYTQYRYGKNHKDGDDKPLDYDAMRLCFKKMNSIFKGKHIGLPKIGCGLAGGSWSIVKKIIASELADCDVTVVIYKK